MHERLLISNITYTVFILLLTLSNEMQKLIPLLLTLDVYLFTIDMT